MLTTHRRDEAFLSFRVECIGKTERATPEHRIQTIGGTKPDGSPWRLSELDAIAGIERGSWVLHIERPGEEAVPLIVALHANKKYLKAHSDGETPDLLLSLPECAPVELQRPQAKVRATLGVL